MLLSGADISGAGVEALVGQRITVGNDNITVLVIAQPAAPVQEITGMEESVVNMQEIFYFKRSSVDASGNTLGEFRASGIRPTLLRRIRERGIELDERIFDENYRYE